MHMNMHKPTGLDFPIDFSTRLRFCAGVRHRRLTHAITLLQSSTRNFFDSVRLLGAISGSTSRAHGLTLLMMMQLSPSASNVMCLSLVKLSYVIGWNLHFMCCVFLIVIAFLRGSLTFSLYSLRMRSERNRPAWEYGSQKRVAVSHICIHFIHIACSYAAHITGNLFEWKWKNLFSSSTVNLGPFVYVN